MHKVRSYGRSGATCIKLGHMSGHVVGLMQGNVHKVRSYGQRAVICQVWATCIKLGHMAGLGNVHKVRSYGRSGQRA